MIDSICNLYAFTLRYAHLLADGLDDAEIADQPAPGLNHPAWILGHLAVVSDSGLRLLGGSPLCPPEWPALFAPGSKPVADRGVYPPKEELLAALARGHEALTAALRGAKPERLAESHGIERLKGVMPTVGDLIAHVMTTHEATHLGQLSAWRRLKGLPGVLGI